MSTHVVRAGPIEVIPAVDVLGGRGGSAHQRDYDRVVERADDPVELAARLGAAGARTASTSSTSTARARARSTRARARGRRARRARAGLRGDPRIGRRPGTALTQAPTGSSSARPPGPTRRRGSSSATRSCSRSTCATARCAPPAGRRAPGFRSVRRSSGPKAPACSSPRSTATGRSPVPTSSSSGPRRRAPGPRGGRRALPARCLRTPGCRRRSSVAGRALPGLPREEHE